MTAAVVARLEAAAPGRGEQAPRRTVGAALLVGGGALVSAALGVTVLPIGLDGMTPATRSALCATACFWTAGLNLAVVLACVRALRTGKACSARRSTLPRAIPGATVRRYTRIT